MTGFSSLCVLDFGVLSLWIQLFSPLYSWTEGLSSGSGKAAALYTPTKLVTRSLMNEFAVSQASPSPFWPQVEFVPLTHEHGCLA